MPTSVVLSSDVLMSVVLPSGVVMTGLVELASVVGEGSSKKMVKNECTSKLPFPVRYRVSTGCQCSLPCFRKILKISNQQ